MPVQRRLVVAGTDDGRRRRAVPLVADLHDLVLVDRILQSLAKTPVPENVVAERRRPRVAVEPQLVEAVQHAADGGQAVRPVQARELRLRYVPGELQRAGLEVGGHRVSVRVELEDDLVDLGSATPVALVGDHAHVVALDPLDGLKGPGADDRRTVGKAVGRGLGRDLRPDVGRQDVDDRAEHVGLGFRAVEPDRVVVDRDHVLDEVRIGREVRHLVLDDVVEREDHIFGRERHAVLPGDAVAQVERPGLAVG